MKKSIVFSVVIAVALFGFAVAGWLFLRTDESQPGEPRDVSSPSADVVKDVDVIRKGKSATKVRADRTGKAKPRLAAKGGVLVESSDEGLEFLPDVKLSESDRKILINMQDALDAEDFKRVAQFAREAMQSPEVEVRRRAVDALSWFGSKALPELTALMADSDDDVAQEARNAAESAVMDIDNPTEKFDTAVSYMKVFKSDEEGMAMFSGAVSLAATELLCESENSPGACEKVVNAMQSLISIGGKCGEEALDRYREITGYEWAGEEEAYKWAADPDNYEPPGEPDDAVELPTEDDNQGNNT